MTDDEILTSGKPRIHYGERHGITCWWVVIPRQRIWIYGFDSHQQAWEYLYPILVSRYWLLPPERRPKLKPPVKALSVPHKPRKPRAKPRERSVADAIAAMLNKPTFRTIAPRKRCPDLDFYESSTRASVVRRAVQRRTPYPIGAYYNG